MTQRVQDQVWTDGGTGCRHTADEIATRPRWRTLDISPTIGKTRTQQTWNQKGHHKQRFTLNLFVEKFQVTAFVLQPTLVCVSSKQFPVLKKTTVFHCSVKKLCLAFGKVLLQVKKEAG
jgi:hypothetical protein